MYLGFGVCESHTLPRVKSEYFMQGYPLGRYFTKVLKSNAIRLSGNEMLSAYVMRITLALTIHEAMLSI